MALVSSDQAILEVSVYVLELARRTLMIYAKTEVARAKATP